MLTISGALLFYGGYPSPSRKLVTTVHEICKDMYGHWKAKLAIVVFALSFGRTEQRINVS